MSQEKQVVLVPDFLTVREVAELIEASPIEVMKRLIAYDWPGNIRELESVMERAVLFCPGTDLLAACLPEEFQTRAMGSTFVIPPLLAMEEIEREAIVQTLERTSGNVKKSAQILRFPRPTFYRKLKKLGIKVARPNGGAMEKKLSNL